MTAAERARRSLLGAARWRAWEPLFWVIAFAAPLVFRQYAAVVSEIAIVALFALSLDLVLGFTGIVSLGHAAFFGLGAYSAGLVARHWAPDPLLGLAVGMAAAAVLGFFASFTVQRGSDLTRLMVTLGGALILLELANKYSEVSGGTDGLQFTPGPLLGRFAFDLEGRTAAYYALAVLLLAFLLVRRLARSPFGATLMAIRDNRLRAMAIGIPVAQRITVIYTVAAALAGAAGALLAQGTALASLDYFEFHRSADLMLMLVIGGTGWLYGGVLGAIVFKLGQDFLSSVTPQYWTFWLGLFLVVLVLVGRDRLLKPWTWFKRRAA